MLAGYARVSTLDQNPELQLDALGAAGCERIFEDRASGARSDRPGLAEALDWMRKGDTLVVWRLDRLGRSLPQLRRQAEAMLRETRGYPFISDVIRSLSIGRTAFYHHFPKERIRELRG